jgi:5'-nucleotidase
MPVTSGIQVSIKINIIYKGDNSNSTKLVGIDIGDEAFNNATTYNVVTLDFLAGGMFEEYKFPMPGDDFRR